MTAEWPLYLMHKWQILAQIRLTGQLLNLYRDSLDQTFIYKWVAARAGRKAEQFISCANKCMVMWSL